MEFLGEVGNVYPDTLFSKILVALTIGFPKFRLIFFKSPSMYRTKFNWGLHVYIIKYCVFGESRVSFAL